jgi:hypothetical protein
MIVKFAKAGGIKVPRNPDGEWDKQKYLHFWVLCEVTLGRPLSWHRAGITIEENARMIAAIPVGDLNKMTLAEIRGRCMDLG